MSPFPSSACRPRSEQAFRHTTETAIRNLEDGRPPWLPSRPRLHSVPGFPPNLIHRCAVSYPAIGPEAETGFHDLFAATGLCSELGAMRTFYCQSRDTIILSDWRSHRNIAGFYRDWIHELVHATGHGSRLGRDLPPVFGSRVDAMEDLVAEMGSALVCARLGLPPALRHPDGVPAWIALLRADSHAWSRAVRAADQAADYLFALRDAQAAAFDRIDAEEALGGAIERIGDQAGRRRRQSERKRWAFGAVTGSRPGESLPAARSGDLP